MFIQQRTSAYQHLSAPTLTVFKDTDVVLQSVIMSGNYYDIWNGQLKSKENLTLEVVVIKAVKGRYLIILGHIFPG